MFAWFRNGARSQDQATIEMTGSEDDTPIRPLDGAAAAAGAALLDMVDGSNQPFTGFSAGVGEARRPCSPERTPALGEARQCAPHSPERTPTPLPTPARERPPAAAATPLRISPRFQRPLMYQTPAHVRSPKVIREERASAAASFEHGMPTSWPIAGGFSSRDAAVENAMRLFVGSALHPESGTLRHWACNHLEGAFSLRIKAIKPAVTALGHGLRGARMRVVCSAEGAERRATAGERERTSIRTGCQYHFYLEDAGETIEVNGDAHFTHNHTMAISAAQRAARSFSRDKLTDEQIAAAKDLQQFGNFSNFEIAKFLRKQAESRGDSVLWSDKDLANHLAINPVDRLFDTAAFFEELKAAEADGALSLPCPRPLCSLHQLMRAIAPMCALAFRCNFALLA